MALVLCGFLVRIIARGFKEEHTDGGNRLVTDGIYSVVRNPMYAGTFLFCVGVILMLFNPWALVLFMAAYLSIYIPEIRKEERILFKAFGEQYQAYCEKTPRFFPDLIRLFALGEHRRIRFSWVRKELRSIILVVLAVIAGQTWKDTVSYGTEELWDEPFEMMAVVAAFIAFLFLVHKKDKK
jgi:uncharacterized membrane protein